MLFFLTFILLILVLKRQKMSKVALQGVIVVLECSIRETLNKNLLLGNVVFIILIKIKYISTRIIDILYMFWKLTNTINSVSMDYHLKLQFLSSQRYIDTFIVDHLLTSIIFVSNLSGLNWSLHLFSRWTYGPLKLGA